MADGYEVANYRSSIVEIFINDKVLAELILNRTITTIDDSDLQTELTRHHIFPYLKKPDFQDTSSVVILVGIKDNQSRRNSSFVEFEITIYCIAHEDIIKIPKGKPHSGCLRTDLMCARIRELLFEKQNFGLGELEYMGGDEVQLASSSFGGRVIRLGKMKDFRKSGC